jgi:hypothetical protein
MGGDVHAQSVISQGATFTVERPLALARHPVPA